MKKTVDWSFFGLKEAPFSVTPDPAYLFLTMSHEGALSNLYYGIGERKGFMMITGEVGTGKTTLCRALLKQLDKSVHKALILSSGFDRDELVRLIAADFGLEDGKGGKVENVEGLNQFLVSRLSRGENAVLVIDEAQNLSDATLEEIRLISNLETDREKLIQIILVGQPELREKLARSHLRQLDQRITIRYHLRPLSRKEAQAYIRHRLKVAGDGVKALFSPSALGAIHRWSRGYPRLINTLCDRSLLEAYREGSPAVSGKNVRTSLRSLENEPRPRTAFPWKWAAIAAAAVVIGSLLGWTKDGWWEKLTAGRELSPQAVAPAPAVTQPASTPTVEQGVPVEAVPQVDEHGIVRASNSEGTLSASIATLFHIWKMDFLAGESRTWKIVNVSPMLLQVFFRELGIAEQYGVSFYARPADLGTIRGFDLPCFFRYRDSATGDSGYAVLAGLREETAIVYDPLSGRREVLAPELLADIEEQLFYMLKEKEVLKALKKGARGSEVMVLQERLQGTGFFPDTPNGVFGEETHRAVRALQYRYDLEADGVVGLETRLILSRLSGGYAPSLGDDR